MAAYEHKVHDSVPRGRIEEDQKAPREKKLATRVFGAVFCDVLVRCRNETAVRLNNI